LSICILILSIFILGVKKALILIQNLRNRMSIKSPRAAKIIQEYKKKPGIVPAIQEYKKNPAHKTGDTGIRDSYKATAQDSRYK
jgi:hypothetical protein